VPVIFTTPLKTVSACSNLLAKRVANVSNVQYGAALAKRKSESLDTWDEELDFHRSLANGAWLSDQLIKARLGYRAVTLFVHIEAVRVAWRFAVNRHAEAHRSC
jgi:hypothetical protein